MRSCVPKFKPGPRRQQWVGVHKQNSRLAVGAATSWGCRPRASYGLWITAGRGCCCIVVWSATGKFRARGTGAVSGCALQVGCWACHATHYRPVHRTSDGGRQELLCPAITQLQLQQQVNPAWIQHISVQAVQWCTLSTAQTLLDNHKAFGVIYQEIISPFTLERTLMRQLPTGSSWNLSWNLWKNSMLTSNNWLSVTRCFQVHVLLVVA